MSIQIRSHNHRQDFSLVGDFLVETYRPGDRLTNWLQPRWEYMHFHPLKKGLDLSKIGVAEDGGKILGVVHFEHAEWQVYFQLRPGFYHIKTSLFDFAEGNFKGTSESTGRLMRTIYINEFDTELQDIATSRGYQKSVDSGEVMSGFILDKPVPDCTLPEGISLQSLEDELDLRKINRVLWRGFNHPSPAPDEEIEGRREVMQAPNFSKDPTTVVVGADGNYVSYSGMWVVAENRVAYVEPVATDPDFCRMGLGKAAVLESIRRAAALGAEVVWIGSGQAFFLFDRF